MKERPILFSGPMVRAILEGRKTQTRRPVKPQPPAYIDELYGGELRQRAPYQLECHESGCVLGYGFEDDNGQLYQCPFGVPGDRLWVRETFGLGWRDGCGGYSALRPTGEQYDRPDKVFFKADFPDDDEKNGKRCWRPSIHMPRWASRITLEVVSVRVERVRDISEEDAQAEGVEWPAPWSGVGGVTHPTCIDAFRELWESVYGAESWHSNQWVWVVEFNRVEQGGVK